ncbi:MAG: DOMON domain-containing protein [Chloroflexota bacterium]
MEMRKARASGAMCVRVRTLVVALVAAVALGLSGCAQPDAPAGDGSRQEPPDEENSTPSVEWTADGVITAGEYSGEMDKGTYLLYWSRLDDTVHMGIEAETEGWVAVGIQPGNAMQDADIIIGFVADAQVTVEDHYSTGRFGPHKPDTEQGGTNDILAFGGKEADGVTVIEFSRKLDTGDEYDNPLTAGATNAVIWAYGTADNTSLQHAPRGYGEIAL